MEDTFSTLVGFGIRWEVRGFAIADDCAFSFGAEIDSAAFRGNTEIVLTSTEEVVNGDIPATGIGPRKLGVWSMLGRDWRSVVDLTEPAGTIMPWGEWVISFHSDPSHWVIRRHHPWPSIPKVGASLWLAQIASPLSL